MDTIEHSKMGQSEASPKKQDESAHVSEVGTKFGKILSLALGTVWPLYACRLCVVFSNPSTRMDSGEVAMAYGMIACLEIVLYFEWKALKRRNLSTVRVWERFVMIATAFILVYGASTYDRLRGAVLEVHSASQVSVEKLQSIQERMREGK
jgi:hypothetical protein